jgi:hypothetical protein
LEDTTNNALILLKERFEKRTKDLATAQNKQEKLQIAIEGICSSIGSAIHSRNGSVIVSGNQTVASVSR